MSNNLHVKLSAILPIFYAACILAMAGCEITGYPPEISWKSAMVYPISLGVITLFCSFLCSSLWAIIANGISLVFSGIGYINPDYSHTVIIFAILISGVIAVLAIHAHPQFNTEGA